MAKTIDELKSAAAVVRDATDDGENTALRVGQLFIDTIDTLSAIAANTLKGYKAITATSQLPDEPTPEQRQLAYILGYTIYVYTGTGGDTLDGLYQSVNIKGPQGDKGDTGVTLGQVALVNDLTTGGDSDALTAEQGKALKSHIDMLRNGLSADIDFSVTGRYYTSTGAQYTGAGNAFVATEKTAIPFGCDRVRVKVRALSSMSAIAFYTDIYTVLSVVPGTGSVSDGLKDYDVEIPTGAILVASCDRDTTNTHAGILCQCYNSQQSVHSVDLRLQAVEQVIGSMDLPGAMRSELEVPLVNRREYYDSDGDKVSGPTIQEKYKSTGQVTIPHGYDRIRVTTHSTSAMSAIVFSDGTRHRLKAALSQSTRTFDVAIPDGAAWFAASTDYAPTFRCILYDSTRWTDDYINVLILGDSITDTLTVDTQEGISIDTNHAATAYHERSPQKWPSLLSQWRHVRELRNYAKQGAHWCDFNNAHFRQQLSEQVQIAIADRNNDTLFCHQQVNGNEVSDSGAVSDFNPDLIIIACGTNDATFIGSGTSQLGDAVQTMLKATSNLDLGIFTDAIRVNVQALKAQWTEAQLFVAVPIQRADGNSLVHSVRGQMIKICNDVVQTGTPAVPGLDVHTIDCFYECGIRNGDNTDATTSDGLHPNAYGQAMLAEAIIHGIQRHNAL